MSWTSVSNDGPNEGGIPVTSGSGALWDDQEEELFRRLYTGGHDLEKIRERFGLPSVDAVTQRAYRRGLKRPSSIARKEKDDVATRLRVLLGEEARPASERRLFADEELLRFAGRGLEDDELAAWRASTWERLEPWIVEPPSSLRDGREAAWARLHGLDRFAREAVKLELMDHQLAMALVCLASKRALCLAGRQSGKDYTQAALSLWEAVVQPGSRIVIISGSQRQSELLAERILAFAAREEKVADSILSPASREKIPFTNESAIRAFPSSGLIRGETAHRVLVNEARDVQNEEEAYSAVEPMLLTTGGSLSIFTTPYGRQGRIWEAFQSPLFLKTRIPSSASRYATPDHLEAQRLEMSAALYANEYEAEFLDVQDAFFSEESIAAATRDYDLALRAFEGEAYALGVDWARLRDSSVMLVLGRDEEGLHHVRFLKAFLNVPIPDQVAHVLLLHRTFRFASIVSEYAGLGIGPTDQLQKELGAVVEPFKPTGERKALAYDGLKQLLERREMVLPRHPKLLAELRTLGFRLTPSGAVTIHHPGGGSDDYADALMLAVWGLRAERQGSRVHVIKRTRWPY